MGTENKCLVCESEVHILYAALGCIKVFDWQDGHHDYVNYLSNEVGKFHCS